MGTTNLNGVITLADKTCELVGRVAIREKVNLILTGYGTAGATDLHAAIVYDGALMAHLTPLVNYGTYIGGELSTNTTEIVAEFSNMSTAAHKRMSFVIWDTTNSCLLVNDWIKVYNNPYDPSMADPTPVEPIGGVDYAPLANGVTNGNTHTHQNGDGADLATYYIKRSEAGAFFRQSSDNLDIELLDRVNGTWHTLILANGTLGIGPAL
jgi:hypothetical protein